MLPSKEFKTWESVYLYAFCNHERVDQSIKFIGLMRETIVYPFDRLMIEIQMRSNIVSENELELVLSQVEDRLQKSPMLDLRLFYSDYCDAI